jgi:steroid delta-isomerase-like uncharacterized protein
MAQEDNQKITRAVFDAWNAHDLDGYVKLLDEKHVIESDTIPQPLTGHQAARQFMQIYVSAFPDLHFEIPQMLASGDFVVTRWTATGTHRGELMGIAATNRRTTTHGCSVTQYRNGKAIHDWVYWDSGNLLRQLGVLPPNQ